MAGENSSRRASEARGRKVPDRRGAARSAREKNDCPALSLAQVLPAARFFVADDIVATGCCDEASLCGPGDVFVARITADGDGHDDVATALDRGAVGVVAERMVPTFGTPLCIVPDARWAMARLSHALRGDPAAGLQMILVTGTSGKTTTAWLTASVLSEAGLRVGVLSDLGCLDAEAAQPEAADLSRPQVLASWLKRLADGGCTHAVVEVSSTMLAENVLAGVACGTIVVTNLASARIGQHGTAAAYRRLKGRILENLSPGGCLIAASGDSWVDRLVARRLESAPDGAVITAGLASTADVTATLVERSLAGQTFLMRSGGHALPVAVSTPVVSFARDSLLAAAVGLRFRVPLERVARGLESADSVPGRIERIDHGQDHAAFVDHPSSGHALGTTLASLRRLTPGRLVVLAEQAAVDRVADGATDDDAVLGHFGRRIARWTDDCLVVPPSLLDEDAGAADIAAYARVDRLLSRLGPQDCLLVLGDPTHVLPGPVGPDDRPPSLAAMVDGWLQLSQSQQPFETLRRAA